MRRGSSPGRHAPPACSKKRQDVYHLGAGDDFKGMRMCGVVRALICDESDHEIVRVWDYRPWVFELIW